MMRFGRMCSKTRRIERANCDCAPTTVRAWLLMRPAMRYSGRRGRFMFAPRVISRHGAGRAPVEVPVEIRRAVVRVATLHRVLPRARDQSLEHEEIDRLTRAL